MAFDPSTATLVSGFDPSTATPADSTLDAQQQVYNQQNYQPVENSPAFDPGTATLVSSFDPSSARLIAAPGDETAWKAATSLMPHGDIIRNLYTADEARQAGQNLATFGKAAGAGALNIASDIYGATPSGVAENVANRVTGQPTTQQQAQDAAAAIQPHPAQDDIGGRVEANLGGLESMLGAGLIGSGGTATTVGKRALQGVRTMAIPAADQARLAYEEGLKAGLTPVQAAFRAGIAGAGTLASGALPASLGASLATKMLAGGAIQTGISEAQSAAENAVSPEELQHTPDALDRTLSFGIGAGFGAAMGHTPTHQESAQNLADQFIKTNAAKGNPVDAGVAQANEILKGAGVTPDVIGESTALKQAAATTPTEADKPVTIEPIRNGTRVLLRGDVETMQAQLHDAGVAPGMVKFENGKAVGIYYPASYKDEVSKVLIGDENAPSPLENAPAENTQTQVPPTESTATNGPVAGDEVRPVQPNIDSNQPVAENNDAAVTYSKEATPEVKPEPPKPQTLSEHVNAFVKDNPQMFRTHLLPGKTVREMVDEDGEDRYLGQYHEDGAQVHRISLDQGDEQHGAIGKIYEDKNDVWIDAASLKTGAKAGERLYNMAESLALNTGKNFKEDPAGVSDMAMYRRPWHQLSMLLKSGAADNIKPGEFLSTQRVGGPKTRPINYPANRNYEGMLREHLLTVYHNTALAVPEIKGITYDLKSGQFTDRAGNAVSDGDFKRLAANRRADPIREAMVRTSDSGVDVSPPPVGWRSLKAAGIAKALLQHGALPALHEPGRLGESGVGAPSEPQSNARAPAGILPSKGKAGSGNAAAAVQRHYGTSTIARLKRAGVHFANAQDVIDHQIGGHKSLDELNGVKGFTTADRNHVVILNDRVSDQEAPGILAHEVVHKNLPAMLGEPRFQALTKAAERSQDADVAKARARVPQDTPAAHRGEETLGYLAEQNPNHPLVQRAVDAVKLMLNKAGIPLNKLNAEGAALRKIIALNLKHAAETAPDGTHLVDEGGQLRNKPRIKAPLSVWGDQLGKDTQTGQEDTQTGQAIGAKNAETTAQREKRGLGPIETILGNDFGENNDAAAKILAENPHYGEELAASLAAKPRPHTDEEFAVLLRDRVRLQNLHADVMARAEKAMDAGDNTTELGARIVAKELEAKLETNEKATKYSGSETGKGLGARRMMMKEDMSLARVITRARVANGGDINDAQRASLEAKVKNIAKLDGEIQEEHNARVQTKRAPRGNPKALDSEFDSLKAELARIAKKPAAQPNGTLYHKAFHGSPHDFDKFDSTKIGTGEGAQAYGHGLYFAGKKEVADHYRQALSLRDPTALQNHALKNGANPELADTMAQFYASSRSSDFGRFKTVVMEKSPNEYIERFRDKYIRPSIEDGSAEKIWRTFREAGRGYEVELAPKETDYLNWDKPLSEQSPEVQKALANSKESIVSYWADKSRENPAYNGEDLYKRLSGTLGDDRKASGHLHELGIPGIKYLDGTSRARTGGEIIAVTKSEDGWRSRIKVERGGDQLFTTSRPYATEAEARNWAQDQINQGHHNYVIFNDKDVQILNKYSKAAPDVAAIIRRMAENRNAAGVDGEEMVKQIHDAVKDYADVTPRDVRDAISGYGKERQPTKDELKIRFTALKAELRNLSKTEDVQSGKVDPNAAKNKARQTQLQKQIAQMKHQLQTGDYSKPEKTPPVYDAKTFEKQAERDALAKQVDSQISKIAKANRGKTEKVVDFALGWRRAAILSGIPTLGKLSAAALSRVAMTPIEESIGSVLRHIPGIGAIDAKAPREGGGISAKAEGAAAGKTLSKEMLQEAGRKLKTGIDNMDALYGGKIEHDEDYFRYVGQMHGALKTPAKINEFYRSITKRAQFERNRVIAAGMTPAEADAHIADTATQAWLGAKAYQDANRAIFMGDNRLLSTIRLALHVAENAPEGTTTRFFGKLGSKAFSYEFPIMKVPVNFVAETLSYAAGGAKAALQLIIAKGVKNLNGDQADYIMRNLKKQTVGAALMYIGAMGYQSVGGYYQQGDNKDEGRIKAGAAKIYGHEIPHFLLHTPPMEAINLGATYMRIMKKRQSAGEGLMAAAKGLFEEVPFIGQTGHIASQLTNTKTLGKAAGSMVRELIPAAVQNIAAWTDPAKQRKPTNFTQEIETGLPGLREKVPTQ